MWCRLRRGDALGIVIHVCTRLNVRIKQWGRSPSLIGPSDDANAGRGMRSNSMRCVRSNLESTRSGWGGKVRSTDRRWVTVIKPKSFILRCRARYVLLRPSPEAKRNIEHRNQSMLPLLTPMEAMVWGDWLSWQRHLTEMRQGSDLQQISLMRLLHMLWVFTGKTHSDLEHPSMLASMRAATYLGYSCISADLYGVHAMLQDSFHRSCSCDQIPDARTHFPVLWFHSHLTHRGWAPASWPGMQLV